MELAELFGHTDDKEKGKKEDPDDEGISDEEHDQTKDDAAKHMMEMTRKGDHKGFRAALESFMDLHKASEDKPKDDHEDDGTPGEEDDDLKL